MTLPTLMPLFQTLPPNQYGPAPNYKVFATWNFSQLNTNYDLIWGKDINNKRERENFVYTSYRKE